VPKLAVQLHLPVQAGSDRVLMAMKRNHTVLQYKSIIRKLKAASPNLTITSDFIIGFPGETEKDFEATVKLMQDVGFDYSFSFLYSPRPGTPAAFIEDDTPHKTKLDRLSRLQAINNQQGDAISRDMLGSTQRLLVEGVSKKDPTVLVGKTDNNRIVTIAKGDGLIGTFVAIKVTNTDNPKRLQGELI